MNNVMKDPEQEESEVEEAEGVEGATTAIIIVKGNAVNQVTTTLHRMIKTETKTEIKMIEEVEDQEDSVSASDAHRHAALMMKIVEMIVTVRMIVIAAMVEVAEIVVMTEMAEIIEIGEIPVIAGTTAIVEMIVRGMVTDAETIVKEGTTGTTIRIDVMMVIKTANGAVLGQREDSDKAPDKTRVRVKEKVGNRVVPTMQVTRHRSKYQTLRFTESKGI